MQTTFNPSNVAIFNQFRTFFRTRDFLFHDGRALRRFSIAGRTQALLAGAAAVTLGFSAYGAGQAMVAASGMAADVAVSSEVDAMRAKVAKMQGDVARIKVAATQQAKRVEQRQAFIAAVLSGKGDPEQLAVLIRPAAEQDARTASILQPLHRVEARQVALAETAEATTRARYAAMVRQVRKLGINPSRIAKTSSTAMGGPFEPVEGAVPGSATETVSEADSQFRSLFQTWKKLDTLEQAVIAIPSLQPVENLTLTSSFGVRSDPFRGTAAMHAGLDIPGPLGTPIYATADGIVARSGRAGGYGNLVEINHGKGIQTRYGHMSKILVPANQRVRRGQLIGLMGSTGRSTGSHLHYEVRIDGRAVNPIPYMQTADSLLAIQDRATRARQVGGPLAAN
ncbi:M23 family metallopeptidase [Sphingomonas japonica]|uniref:Murein DD-endopeptidase MepM/ murein hydrolase activator NlpD n=1 Tax=Sphingomonas japonica TaxID=511662 RepID=A0ABX0TWW2_9SPHN|nr:M23 family metallopeptidase [Sphingomonas japonica]NIJ22799.1 murein DD-endopeptidase MepM/ murein hydrolase activator NlpD [Sphingomonas japonica]